jgi:hypothetical protein
MKLKLWPANSFIPFPMLVPEDCCLDAETPIALPFRVLSTFYEEGKNTKTTRCVK